MYVTFAYALFCHVKYCGDQDLPKIAKSNLKTVKLKLFSGGHNVIAVATPETPN